MSFFNFVILLCSFPNVYGNTEKTFHNGQKTYLVSGVIQSSTSAALFCKKRNMEMVTFENDADLEFFANNVHEMTWTGYTFSETNDDWTDFNGNVATFSTSTAQAHAFSNRCLVVVIYNRFGIAGVPCSSRYQCACQSFNNTIINNTNHSITAITSAIGGINEAISNIFSILREMNQSISSIKSLSAETNIFYQNMTSTMEKFHSNSIQMKNNCAFYNDAVKVHNETNSLKENEKLKDPYSYGMDYFFVPVYLLLNVSASSIFIVILIIRQIWKSKKPDV